MDDIKTFETLYDLTSHPGWPVIIEDLLEKVEVIKDANIRISPVDPSLYQMGVTHGIAKAYSEFITLRYALETAMKQHKEDLDEIDNV